MGCGSSPGSSWFSIIRLVVAIEFRPPFMRATEAALRAQGTSLTLFGPLLWLSWRGPMLQRDLVKASAVKQPAMVATLD
ncbi:hypothetical protein PsyrH_12875 [Pseudomonas syringae pv. syringae HS191]|nr:hypothetical protein PsyrH_12875 [Pseudomonas syringae pv. syringae HS191]